MADSCVHSMTGLIMWVSSSSAWGASTSSAVWPKTVFLRIDDHQLERADRLARLGGHVHRREVHEAGVRRDDRTSADDADAPAAALQHAALDHPATIQKRPVPAANLHPVVPPIVHADAVAPAVRRALPPHRHRTRRHVHVVLVALGEHRRRQHRRLLGQQLESLEAQLHLGSPSAPDQPCCLGEVQQRDSAGQADAREVLPRESNVQKRVIDVDISNAVVTPDVLRQNLRAEASADGIQRDERATHLVLEAQLRLSQGHALQLSTAPQNLAV
eukprot:scaffold2602_cov246-Pinguiococcus_pyrenoidosus.AAC.5